jgi:uncharacterized protein DUF4256
MLGWFSEWLSPAGISSEQQVVACVSGRSNELRIRVARKPRHNSGVDQIRGTAERTRGEPDVVSHDKKTGECISCDCSAESPSGRRSVRYDREALAARKEHKPQNSALEMAAAARPR